MVEVAVLFAAVFELKSVFVAGSVAGEPLVGKVGIHDDAHALAGRGFEADAEGCVFGVRAVDDATAACGECVMDELEQGLAVSAADTIDAVRERVIGWPDHLARCCG